LNGKGVGLEKNGGLRLIEPSRCPASFHGFTQFGNLPGEVASEIKWAPPSWDESRPEKALLFKR